jgi:cobalt-zinc-cadmium efflux system membrane fusion protein
VGVTIDARVRRVVAVPGDVVSAGDLLAELESVEVGHARAALVAARARSTVARASLERRQALGAEVVSRRDVEQAEADAAVAIAEERAAEAALVGLGVGSSTEGGAVFALRAPIAGRVLAREARRGDLVDPEHTLFEVADTQVLWLIAHASERDALRVRVADEVEVLFAALPNEPRTAVVARVGEMVDPASRTIPLRIDVPNPDGRLRPGMSATARVPLGGSGGPVVAVPGPALQRLDDAWVVFVPAPDGRFAIRPVGRGRDLGADVEVLSWLGEGEAVVVDGAFLLKAQAEKQAGGGDAHHH